MALSKDELREALEKTHSLLSQVSGISPVNHADIKRKAITSYAMEHVVKPCKNMLEEIILVDREQGLTLDDTKFNSMVEDIEISIKNVKDKLLKCEPETPQTFY